MDEPTPFWEDGTIGPQSSSASAKAFSSDEQRWLAVCERDPAAQGLFYYAVVTTGTYCRPSCGSRRPLRRNVIFFSNGGQAEAAGFQPCKRCAPDQLPLEETNAAIVAAACKQIDEALETPTLEELAVKARMKPFHLHRLFKRLTGTTPRIYAAARKAGGIGKSFVER